MRKLDGLGVYIYVCDKNRIPLAFILTVTVETKLYIAKRRGTVWRQLDSFFPLEFETFRRNIYCMRFNRVCTCTYSWILFKTQVWYPISRCARIQILVKHLNI